MSSFKGDDLFGSGPHRFVVGREGRYVVSEAAAAGTPVVAGSRTYGDRELRITVTGRLVAASAAGLWALRDAIVTAADSTNTKGTLTDGQGRSWADVVLISFEPAGAVDRGREHSLGYAAVFGRTLD